MRRYDIAVRTLKIKTPNFDDLNQASHVTFGRGPPLI